MGFSHCAIHRETNQCITCGSTEPLHNIQSCSTECIYPIQGDVICNTGNVIYVVTCKLCQKQYTWETERPIRYRFLEHRRATYNHDETNAVAKHFITHHPNTPVSKSYVPISITPLEQISDQGSQD